MYPTQHCILIILMFTFVRIAYSSKKYLLDHSRYTVKYQYVVKSSCQYCYLTVFIQTKTSCK